jgi:hypothetical protein
MPSASIGIELISEPFLIPVWFYIYSTIVYAASAVISLLITYFSYKFFKISRSRQSLIFMFSFLLLGIGFSALAFTSMYTYMYKPFFKDAVGLSLSLLNSAGLSMYYVTATVAYVSILLMYLSNDLFKFLRKKLLVLYVPFWYLDLSDFHLASILILAYVLVRNVVNFYKSRNVNSFLVMFAFLCIIGFHSFLLFASLDPTAYLVANTVLAVGFCSLLIMLIRVSRIDRKKI